MFDRSLISYYLLTTLLVWSALNFSQTFASVFTRLWRHGEHVLFLKWFIHFLFIITILILCFTYSSDNKSCLSWDSIRVEVVDLSAPYLSKSFSIEPYHICYLPIKNSFEYQLLDGAWKTKTFTRNVFELKDQNELQVNKKMCPDVLII